MPLTPLPLDTDMPVARLAGVAPAGISRPSGRVGGMLRQVATRATYGDGERTVTTVARPGSDFGSPRLALCWQLFRVAVADAMAAGIDDPTDVHARELEPAAHVFSTATLVVNGVGYTGWQIAEHGVVARAALVGSWTVLACVSDGQLFPEVVTESFAPAA